MLNSGAALFIIEATGVSPEGRITPACLGLWDDRTEAALRDKLNRARALAPPMPVFIQLAHAGRKASSATPWQGGQLLEKAQGGWDTLAPSPIPQLEGGRLPLYKPRWSWEAAANLGGAVTANERYWRCLPREAQAYPDRPITLVVPNPPGGLVNTSARLLSEPLTRVIGQTVVVDNKLGASGNIAYQFVANAKPDGYTLLISYSGYHVGNPALFDKLTWDPIKDFSPVALLTVSTNVIAVHPSVPVNSLKELIAYAKANPGKLNYASQGNGSVSHIGAEIFKQTTGVDMVHVPYRGSGPVIQDVLAGQVQVFIITPPSVM